jgi:hypothetical protein
MISDDANAHTSNLPDFVEFDEFLSDYLNFDSETIYSFNEINYLDSLEIPRKRTSQCNKTKKVGRKLLEICNNNNIFILNGRIGNDRSISKFTFRDRNVCN